MMPSPNQSNAVSALQAVIQARKMSQDALTNLGNNLVRDTQAFNEQIERQKESKRKDEQTKAQVQNLNANTQHTQMQTKEQPKNFESTRKVQDAQAAYTNSQNQDLRNSIGFLTGQEIGRQYHANKGDNNFRKNIAKGVRAFGQDETLLAQQIAGGVKQPPQNNENIYLASNTHTSRM